MAALRYGSWWEGKARIGAVLPIRLTLPLLASLVFLAVAPAVALAAPRDLPIAAKAVTGLCSQLRRIAEPEQVQLGPLRADGRETLTLRLRSRLDRDCRLVTRIAVWRVGDPRLQAAAMLYTRAMVEAAAALAPGADGTALHRIAGDQVLRDLRLPELAAIWQALVDAIGSPVMPPSLGTRTAWKEY